MADSSSKAFSIDTEGEGAEIPTLTSLLYRKNKISAKKGASLTAPQEANMGLEPTKTGTITSTKTPSQASTVELSKLVKPAKQWHELSKSSKKTSLAPITEVLTQLMSVFGKTVALKIGDQSLESYLQGPFKENVQVCFILKKDNEELKPLIQYAKNPKDTYLMQAGPKSSRWKYFWKRVTESSTQDIVLECTNLLRADQPSEAYKQGLRKLFHAGANEILYVLVHTENPVMIAFTLPQTSKIQIKQLVSVWGNRSTTSRSTKAA